MKALQVPSYIIHRRPYRETSVIIDAIAAGYGRVHMVLKGAHPRGKSTKKASSSALAQAFKPLLLSFSGNGELKTNIGIEDNGVGFALTDIYLYSGFDLNELIGRLWPQNVTSQQLYPLYHNCLQAMSVAQTSTQQIASDDQQVLEILLRQFEFDLLQQLGFGVDCFYTHQEQVPIAAENHYYFTPCEGFSLTDLSSNMTTGGNRTRVFNGAHILAIGEHKLANAEVLKAAKQLSRLALSPYLGDKPLKSRELFIKP